jgi:hypothetical protein
MAISNRAIKDRSFGRGSDYYQGSSIDARLREMQRQYQDELKEQGKIPG